MTPRLVLVLWEDITSSPKWVSKKEARATKVAKVTSVGWLISDTKKYVRLAGDLAADGDVGNCTTIPRGCITKMADLTPSFSPVVDEGKDP